ncbi:hypothetical protein C1645_812747 [Glomus cerebriforme]|uniref:Uncharacterized protein n=1 Tax=Glomus cerebriforme TaxID=658196 RepID=A0A397TU93_9GLOM|nr:hypothetical protein C1645_812747 [Glomus cerebriforme]
MEEVKPDINKLNMELSKLELKLKNHLPWQFEYLKDEQLKVELKEKDREIKVLKNQVENLAAELRKIDILSTYRDIISCFKVFISEELSKNTQFPNDWQLTKKALTKIMGPLEKWLLLQQAPKHEEPVTKIYDESDQYFVASKATRRQKR